jgi:phosphinothricin acetyltransferase
MIFREAIKEDKDFILNANRVINELSDLDDSTFEKRIDEDLFEKRICKSIVAEIDGSIVGFILYSYIYWANLGKGIYLSQTFVKEDYRGQGIHKQLLDELVKKESDCHFMTCLVGDENDVIKNTLSKLDFKTSDLITYCKGIN